MRIGIDASRAFVDQRTGTENYSYQMIRHLLTLPEAKEHEWVLYVKQIQDLGFWNHESKFVDQKLISLPLLWTQLGLAWRTWTDDLDCLWVPAHTLPVLRRPGLKTVVTIHGIEYEYLPSFQNPLQRWYLPLSTQYAVHSASKLIAVSEFTKSQLIERLHADPNKIMVVHEGVSTSPSIPLLDSGEGSRRQGEVLRRHRLRAKSYVLFIGTVQPRKNLKRLIDAFLDIQNKQIDLVIIGKMGWGYEDLPINKYNNVKFLGYVNDSERDVLLESALAYVQPSITEGFGLPILEAFAAGVPVVSSVGGALKEVVGEAGLLFDPYNNSNIKDQISKIIEDENLRTRLIARGRRRLQQFSWEKAAKETYSVLTRG